MNTFFNVVGLYELEGFTFAHCTTYQKAKKAQELLEAEGFEYMLEIVPDQLPIDVVTINGKQIHL